jgi:AraC-like DNA-binding protein
MLYREYPPHPALAAHVDCLWTARVLSVLSVHPGRAHLHRVLPDNCVDILWQDGSRPAFAVGMMSTPIQVASDTPVSTVAVRFKPGAAGAFLATPLHVLTDQRADLDLLWDRADADRLADALWTGALTDRERIALIETQLIRRLRGFNAATATASGVIDGAGGVAGVGGANGAALIRRALDVIDTSGGGVRIDELAARLDVSRQHLAAQFRTRVGLSPKLYARICRFRRATAALKAAPTPDWAQLALECGYFDQSHLIHDFQEFAGSAPERFLSAR